MLSYCCPTIQRQGARATPTVNWRRQKQISTPKPRPPNSAPARTWRALAGAVRVAGAAALRSETGEAARGEPVPESAGGARGSHLEAGGAAGDAAEEVAPGRVGFPAGGAVGEWR
jgi:hypothetical protein